MTVEDLRAMLRSVESLLAAADGKKATLAAVGEFIAALAPFDGKTLPQFVALAAKGMNPPAPAKPDGAGGKAAVVKGKKLTTDEVKAVADEVKLLYDTAEQPEVTGERIEGVCAKLPSLQKKQLQDIAKSINMVVSSRATIPELVKEIGGRLRRRKGIEIRDELATPVMQGQTPPAGELAGVGGG